MSAPEKGPLSAALSAVFLLCVICVLLWVAVTIIQAIWVWLLIGLLAAGLVWAVVVALRLRRDRW
ncbi:hypothetical protein [Microbacterium schleiferi]|uniref:DUF4175 domain-containing protein n=1 Tax=Microbacterium schleiferi TaxID=69362 RepID=A0ABU7V945_9MICO